jgi:hypothetical protein
MAISRNYKALKIYPRNKNPIKVDKTVQGRACPKVRRMPITRNAKYKPISKITDPARTK